jgi:hypothetical protein
VHEAIHALQDFREYGKYSFNLKRVYPPEVKQSLPHLQDKEAEASANENNCELVIAHFRKMLGEASWVDEALIKLHTPIF